MVLTSSAHKKLEVPHACETEGKPHRKSKVHHIRVHGAQARTVLPIKAQILTKARTDLSLLLASRCQQLAQEAPSPPLPEHQSSGLQGQEVHKACTAHSTITTNVATI